VPARYAIGFSVQEWSRLEQRWIVRSRHAHAWALAHVDGVWREVDTTPPVWADAERDEASMLEPLRDLWSWGGFLFSRWRWGEEEDGVGRYAGWLLIPLLLLLGWRLYSRRRVGRGAAAPGGARELAPPPGHDSEFYLIASRLDAAGLGRHPSEPASVWIERIHASELRPIVDLHYRYRSDPAAPPPTDRTPPPPTPEAWLTPHPPTQPTV